MQHNTTLVLWYASLPHRTYLRCCTGVVANSECTRKSHCSSGTNQSADAYERYICGHNRMQVLVGTQRTRIHLPTPPNPPTFTLSSSLGAGMGDHVCLGPKLSDVCNELMDGLLNGVSTAVEDMKSGADEATPQQISSQVDLGLPTRACALAVVTHCLCSWCNPLHYANIA